MGDTWELEGLQELNKKLTEITKSLNPDKVEPVLSKGARVLSSAIRSKAPKGPTGNLKKSVKTKKLKPLAWNAPAGSIAAIDSKIAPHAWLVEHGHNTKGGDRVEGKGFFRNAVDENSQRVITTVSKEIEKLIEGAIK